MSNATRVPPDVPVLAPTEVPPPIDYERIPPTGVRKVPITTDEPVEEPPVPRLRWGAVLAGLFVSTGGQILLWMLGFAVGLAVIARPMDRPPGFGVGPAIWVGLVLLVTLFAGGYVAARLAGATRRSEGLLAGGLVWSVSAVAALWILGSSAMLAMPLVPRVSAPPIQQMGGPDLAFEQPYPPPPRVTPADLSRAAWGAFAYAAISLLGALAGGARGAAARGDGTRQSRDEAATPA
jgi:hypothetical protein